MSARSPGRLQRKRSADIARTTRLQDLSNEEAVGPQPAKKCKPLSPVKKIPSQPPTLNSQRETNLSQETIVSPPMSALLHTSASSSSLASPLFEPPSSQLMTIRWGPVSPAFVIKDSRAGSSPPVRGHHRAPPTTGPAQQGRMMRLRAEKTAQLLDTLTALVRSGSTGEDKTAVPEEGKPPPSICEGKPPTSVSEGKPLPTVSDEGNDSSMQEDDFHLGGLEDNSELLADLLNGSSTSWDDLNHARLKEEAAGNHTVAVAATKDVSPYKTTSMRGEPVALYQECTVANDEQLEATEHEFWAVAEDYLATQEERGLCSGTPQSHPSGGEFETEGPFDMTQDEFDLLLSQADERHLKVCEKETPHRPAQPARFVRL